MKKIIWMIAMCFAAGGLYAQSITPQVIGPTGGSFTNGSGTLSFTLGEVATTTLTAGGNTITQGFHQPDMGAPSAIQTPHGEILFSVYPNPAHQQVNIDYDLGSTSATLLVTDAQGKVWRDAIPVSGKGKVDTQSWNFAAGIYLIRLSGDDFSVTKKLVVY